MEIYYKSLQCSYIVSKILAVYLAPVLSIPVHSDDQGLLEPGHQLEFNFTNMGEIELNPMLPLPFYLSEDPNDVHFYLFRDSSDPNSSQEIIFNDRHSLSNSMFNRQEQTIFLLHGFWSNSSSPTPVRIKDTYLKQGLSYNIILVDWGNLSTPDPAEDMFSPLIYPLIVKRSIPITYKRVAEFIHFLSDAQYISLDKIHLIGHSLGAHVAGGVGYMIANHPKNASKKVARITGLDPAGPLFQGIRLQRLLSPKDAEFVDVYHTAIGTLGSKNYYLGHADFFPNGGHHQPGCVHMDLPYLERDFGNNAHSIDIHKFPSIFFGNCSCSHSFVSKIYAATIMKDFVACQCDPAFIDYLTGSLCPGNCTVSVLAGEPCPASAKGHFYFETSEDPMNE